VLPIFLLEDLHDFGNAKSDNPPPPPSKIEIYLGDAKVDDAPPPIPHVIPPLIAIVCIDQREHFITTQNFAT